MTYKPYIQHYLEKHGFKHFAPKAVLFDMDGVIYDSMSRHAVSWHESMKSFGLDMPKDGAYRYEGMRGVETIRLLARQQWQRELSDEEAQRMYDVKSAYFNSLPPARKMKGIVPLMQQIKDCGLKICVVTGSGQHSLLDQLTDTFKGLIEHDLIVTSYDVMHGKPEPDPYLMGMQKSKVKPWEAIVVENAPLGVQAAVAARCFTVAVNTGPLPDQMLADAGANVVLPSIVELGNQWPLLMQGPHITHEQTWEAHFRELQDFVTTNKRLPSRHRLEDHNILNWIKYNRKCIAAGKLSAERKARFEQLMDMAKQYHRLNQYSYAKPIYTGKGLFDDETEE